MPWAFSDQSISIVPLFVMAFVGLKINNNICIRFSLLPTDKSFTPNESQLGLNGALDLGVVKAERSEYIRLVWLPSPFKILASLL